MPEYVLSIIIFFLILLFIPFIPSLLELLLKKDIKPIPIDQKRIKEPDYFGKSFINLLTKALKSSKIEDIENLKSVYLKLTLSREEWVGFLEGEEFLDDVVGTPVVFLKGVVISRKRTFRKEVVVFGNIVFLDACTMRSLYVKGNCMVEAPLRVARWMHVDGILSVKAKADLGVSVYAKKIIIKDKTTFKRMYAQKIETSDETLIDKKTALKELISIKGSLSVKGGLKIGGVEKAVIVEGDMFSEKAIEIEGDVWIKGNIFSQENIYLKNGVVVSEEGRIKSVVARGKIFVEGPFRIYGYMHSESGGEIKP